MAGENCDCGPLHDKPVQFFTVEGRQALEAFISAGELLEFAAINPGPEVVARYLLPGKRVTCHEQWMRFVFREATGRTKPCEDSEEYRLFRQCVYGHIHAEIRL